MARSGPEVVWAPPPDVGERSRIGTYLRWLADHRDLSFASYDELWRWSVTDPGAFWSTVWDHFELPGARGGGPALGGGPMPGARWFEGATLNYAERALARADDGVAVVARSQSRPGPDRTLTWRELGEAVAAARRGLAALGVGRGDRVVAYLPNVPEAIVAFLATASLGATWSSCPPELGVRSVVDRFGQVAPTTLLAVDGYRYGDRAVTRSAEVAEVAAQLPSLRALVWLPHLDGSAAPPALPAGVAALGWGELVAGSGAGDRPAFEAVPFAHPLYVLFSSGTTGPPKAIVHGHGGIALEHTKALALHHDLGPGDRSYWFTTTGWMMWNYLVSSLLVDATVVLFDGDPTHPDLSTTWRLAAEVGASAFGASASFLMACRRAGLRPGHDLDLSALRSVSSTGSPLPAEGFRWVRDAVGPGPMPASISGGTDLCTAVVGGVPLLPAREGRITCRMLGAAVEALDPAGRPVVGEEGELAITAPMPSMPVSFWGDPDGGRYQAAYFERGPGTWYHGDRIVVHADGTCTISGRSDATLNRGGVRIGAAELYAVVEDLPEVADSLVVHLEDRAGGPGRLLLFVQLAPGCALDDGLRRAIDAALVEQLSPRHRPDEVHAVPAIPRTHTGKKLEVPVKRILAGAPTAEVASPGAMADPSALDAFSELARRRAPG